MPMLHPIEGSAAVQKGADFVEIAPTTQMGDATYGVRAKCLQRLIRLDLPVPRTAALSFEAVRKIASGQTFDVATLLGQFGPNPLVSVRPSPALTAWGGPGAVLDIGMNDAQLTTLSDEIGVEPARRLYMRFIMPTRWKSPGLIRTISQCPSIPWHRSCRRSWRPMPRKWTKSFLRTPSNS